MEQKYIATGEAWEEEGDENRPQGSRDSAKLRAAFLRNLPGGL
jgi:hypothetical protein